MNPYKFMERARLLYGSPLSTEQLTQLRIAAPPGLERDAIQAAVTWRNEVGVGEYARRQREERSRLAVSEHDDTTAFDKACADEDRERARDEWHRGDISGSDAYRYRDDETREDS